MAREQHPAGLRLEFPGAVQKLNPAHARHQVVRNGDVHQILFQMLNGLFGTGVSVNFELGLNLQVGPHAGDHHFLVVDNQYRCLLICAQVRPPGGFPAGCWPCSMGRGMGNVVPAPTSLSKSREPPYVSSTIFLEIESPNPVPTPTGLVVKPSATIFGRSSGRIPPPLSNTEMWTRSPSRRVRTVILP